MGSPTSSTRASTSFRRAAATLLLLTFPASVQAAPCLRAAPLAEGATATCTGLLIAPDAAAECIRLKRVVVPRLEGRLEEKSKLLALEKKGRARDVSILRRGCRPSVEPVDEGPDAVTLSVAGVAAFLAGMLSGALVWERLR